MATFAIMSGNKVSNVVVANSKADIEPIFGSNIIEYTKESPAGIGWIWDGTKFTAPEIPEE